MATATVPCRVSWLGRLAYAPATARQEELAALRQRGEGEDTLLLLEHGHVITLGSGSHPEHILVDAERRAELGIELHESSRGGDVTYHGPGQLVGYPILKLEDDRKDAHRYLRDLEEVLIRSVAEYGLTAGRHPEYTGVWVGDAKIAAIGVRLSKWVTSHGFALNVDPDLDYFGSIVPCGIQEKQVGSIASLTGTAPPLLEVAETVARHFAVVFGRSLVGALPGRE